MARLWSNRIVLLILLVSLVAAEDLYSHGFSEADSGDNAGGVYKPLHLLSETGKSKNSTRVVTKFSLTIRLP